MKAKRSQPLGPLAMHLMREIAAGRSRIYAYTDTPNGTALLVRQGLIRRIDGTDRAELTAAGRERIASWVAPPDPTPLCPCGMCAEGAVTCVSTD